MLIKNEAFLCGEAYPQISIDTKYVDEKQHMG
jgi:hypothetical protein